MKLEGKGIKFNVTVGVKFDIKDYNEENKRGGTSCSSCAFDASASINYEAEEINEDIELEELVSSIKIILDSSIKEQIKEQLEDRD